MPIKIPPIREFPKDGRIWRIDWLGAVHRTSDEAQIDVFLSPIKSGIEQPWRQGDFDVSQVQQVKIGVGQIPFLTIGSLWRDRRRLRQPFGKRVTLANVHIDATTARLVDAGASLSENPKRYLIPPFKQAIQKSALSSQCIVIAYNGDKNAILLPVIEAIRFYYAVSTDMAHVVFNGAFQLHRNSVIDAENSGMLEGAQRMVLRLRQWLADDDGWIIGRMLAEPLAQAGAARVFDSMVRDSANRRSVFPECDLPFEGATRWLARCIELQIGDEPKRWLIQELISCSAPFPFEELEVIRDNDGRKAADPEGDLPEEEKKPAWSGPRKVAEISVGTEVQSQEAPLADIVVVDALLAGERFEALRGKQVIKTPKSECHYSSASFGQRQPTDALGTGEAASTETDVAPLNVKWSREEGVQRSKGLPASFETLLQVVDALNTISGVVARVRQPTPEIRYLPLLKPSRMYQWGYLDSGAKVRREMMMIDVICNGVYGSLIEFEQRDSENFTAALLFAETMGQHLSDTSVAVLLRDLASVKGVWSRATWGVDGIRMAIFKHTRPSPEAFAEAIYVAMSV